MKKKKKQQFSNLEKLAYHEAGHTVVAYFIKEYGWPDGSFQFVK